MGHTLKGAAWCGGASTSGPADAGRVASRKAVTTPPRNDAVITSPASTMVPVKNGSPELVANTMAATAAMAALP